MQYPREGDSPVKRYQRLGLFVQRERIREHDRPDPLRRGEDGGSRAEERRTLRRLHPPRGRARVEVRVLRPRSPAGPLPESPAEDSGQNRQHRVREGLGHHGPRGHGGDAGDAGVAGEVADYFCSVSTTDRTSMTPFAEMSVARRVRVARPFLTSATPNENGLKSLTYDSPARGTRSSAASTG